VVKAADVPALLIPLLNTSGGDRDVCPPVSGAQSYVK
jgi:hypothetical protein